jgi:nucleotide-binding universal stress UspA family protein
VNARGPIWQTILEIADERDASAIVMGSRGLGGLKSYGLRALLEGEPSELAGPVIG